MSQVAIKTGQRRIGPMWVAISHSFIPSYRSERIIEHDRLRRNKKTTTNRYIYEILLRIIYFSAYTRLTKMVIMFGLFLKNRSSQKDM